MCTAAMRGEPNSKDRRLSEMRISRNSPSFPRLSLFSKSQVPCTDVMQGVDFHGIKTEL